MGTPLTLALAPGESPAPEGIESWTSPDLLGYSRAEETVDLQSVCDVATHILFLLSGRKFGVRTETIRPIAGMNGCGWDNLGLASFGETMAEEWLYRYQLNEGARDYLFLKSPVQSIQQIKIDGVVLDPSTDYFLFDNRRLVRGPSPEGYSQVWPLYQRVDLDDTQYGTFSITYQWGQTVPTGARMAAQVFATELAKYINREPSALPDRTVTVTRQGVTQTLLDPSQFIAQSRTGLYFVDIWLGSVNPNGNRKRPVVMSPETVQSLRPT